jgi:hypothetical protein
MPCARSNRGNTELPRRFAQRNAKSETGGESAPAESPAHAGVGIPGAGSGLGPAKKMAPGSPTPTVGGLASTCGRGPKSSWRRWSCLPFLNESGREPDVAGHANGPQARPHAYVPAAARRVYWHRHNTYSGLASIQVLSGQSVSSESLCQQQRSAHSAAGRPPTCASGVTGQGIPVDSGDRRPPVGPVPPQREILCW